jgi:chemotaxis regulatin CheY-phosphate phosphatase CheZ
MDAAQVKALAAELETTLDLLAELIGELGRHQATCSENSRVAELVGILASRPNLAELPAVLLRAHADVNEILGGIRLTRAAIEAHAIERIQDTKNRLSDVTATTESATLELMNGLDRSLDLINSLETQANGSASADGFQQLRGQVAALYNHLQFQDITTQQLQGVHHSLLELETRVAAVAVLFDQSLGAIPRVAILPGQQASSDSLPFNPDATMKRTIADQAMIDEAFRGARNGSPSQPGHVVDAGRA